MKIWRSYWNNIRRKLQLIIESIQFLKKKPQCTLTYICLNKIYTIKLMIHVSNRTRTPMWTQFRHYILNLLCLYQIRDDKDFYWHWLACLFMIDVSFVGRSTVFVFRSLYICISSSLFRLGSFLIAHLHVLVYAIQLVSSILHYNCLFLVDCAIVIYYTAANINEIFHCFGEFAISCYIKNKHTGSCSQHYLNSKSNNFENW